MGIKNIPPSESNSNHFYPSSLMLKKNISLSQKWLQDTLCSYSDIFATDFLYLVSNVIWIDTS